MLFVLDKIQLKKMIRIVREDRPRRRQDDDEEVGIPFLRIEARGNEVWVSSGRTAAGLAATVYEAGVLFVRTTFFRKFIGTFVGDQFLTIQANEAGLHVGNARVDLEAADMVLFPFPEQAPATWPRPLPERELPRKNKSRKSTAVTRDRPLPLFDQPPDTDRPMKEGKGT